MKKIIQFVVLINVLIGYGQSNTLLGSGVNNDVNISIYTSGTYVNIGGDRVKTKVGGSPYLFDSWDNISVITTQEDKKYKIQNLNYDARSDIFEAKISQDSVFKFNPSYIKEITINNRRFKKYLNQETGLFNYYEIISSVSDTKILKRNEKVIRIGVTNRLTMEKENDYFILRENYFLNKSGKLTEFSLKKKSILRLFGNKSQMINKFISNNKLSIKEDADLRKIFNYYESIL